MSPNPSNKLTLYDVSLEGVMIADILEANEGELTPELEERLDRLMTLQGSALVCQQESLRLAARAKSFDDNAKRLKERMTIALDCAFGGKVKTNRFTVWTQQAADTTAFDLREEFTMDMLAIDHPELVRVKLELDKAACKRILEEWGALPEEIYVEHSKGKRYARIK